MADVIADEAADIRLIACDHAPCRVDILNVAMGISDQTADFGDLSAGHEHIGPGARDVSVIHADQAAARHAEITADLAGGIAVVDFAGVIGDERADDVVKRVFAQHIGIHDAEIGQFGFVLRYREKRDVGVGRIPDREIQNLVSEDLQMPR